MGLERPSRKALLQMTAAAAAGGFVLGFGGAAIQAPLKDHEKQQLEMDREEAAFSHQVQAKIVAMGELILSHARPKEINRTPLVFSNVPKATQAHGFQVAYQRVYPIRSKSGNITSWQEATIQAFMLKRGRHLLPATTYAVEADSSTCHNPRSYNDCGDNNYSDRDATIKFMGMAHNFPLWDVYDARHDAYLGPDQVTPTFRFIDRVALLAAKHR